MQLLWMLQRYSQFEYRNTNWYHLINSYSLILIIDFDVPYINTILVEG